MRRRTQKLNAPKVAASAPQQAAGEATVKIIVFLGRRP